MTDEAQYQYDIFISYNQADEAWTRSISKDGRRFLN
jgi:hypothetical protein